jgi:prepilin-type N-terminal cleavage/methylation domain-containing protein
MQRKAFTLVEVCIVILILAILAAVVVPAFHDETKNAKATTQRFNLSLMRQQVELYRQEHAGKLPGATLIELTLTTNEAGSAGTGAAFRYGPYLPAIPKNLNTDAATVRVAATNPPSAASGAPDAGWLYHPTSGGIWIDDPDLFTE